MHSGEVKKATRLTVGVGGCLGLNMYVCVCISRRAQRKCRHSVVTLF